MKITIVLLMALLHPLAASSYAPDLCADVFLNASGVPVTDSAGTTLSRFCAWAGPTAPVWDDDICCRVDDQTASCSTTNARGGCESGMKLYCEHGEALADGGFACYQPFPSTCESESCGGTIQASDYIQDDVLCCQNGDCYEWEGQYLDDCLGYFSWCSSGYLNEDGTVDCYD